MANGPYAPMEYGVAQGCCFLSSEFNQYFPEMDWQSPKLESAYHYYVGNLVDDLKTILKKNNYPLTNVTAFIEPNSFGLAKIIGQKDYRQRLHAFDGRRLDLLESKEIVDHTTQFTPPPLSRKASMFSGHQKRSYLETTFTMPFTQQRKAQNILEDFMQIISIEQIASSTDANF